MYKEIGGYYRSHGAALQNEQLPYVLWSILQLTIHRGVMFGLNAMEIVRSNFFLGNIHMLYKDPMCSVVEQRKEASLLQNRL
jgi:hypothetical protein